MAHTSGRKSYKRKRKEVELILGNEPHQLTFCEATHKKKNKHFVNHDAEDNSNAAHQKFVELSQGHEFDTSKLMDEAFLDSINCDQNRCAKHLGLRHTLRSYNGVKHLNLPATNNASGGQSEEVERLKGELQYIKDEMKKLEEEISKMREELNHLKELLSDRVLNYQAMGGNDLDDAFSSNNRSSNGRHKSATKGHRRSV